MWAITMNRKRKKSPSAGGEDIRWMLFPILLRLRLRFCHPDDS